jgi:hypothetical protein
VALNATFTDGLGATATDSLKAKFKPRKRGK